MQISKNVNNDVSMNPPINYVPIFPILKPLAYFLFCNPWPTHLLDMYFLFSPFQYIADTITYYLRDCYNADTRQMGGLISQ